MYSLVVLFITVGTKFRGLMMVFDDDEHLCGHFHGFLN